MIQTQQRFSQPCGKLVLEQIKNKKLKKPPTRLMKS